MLKLHLLHPWRLFIQSLGVPGKTDKTLITCKVTEISRLKDSSRFLFIHRITLDHATGRF